jgi:hypothetical protein
MNGERDRPGRTSWRPADWIDGGERSVNSVSYSAGEDFRLRKFDDHALPKRKEGSGTPGTATGTVALRELMAPFRLNADAD